MPATTESPRATAPRQTRAIRVLCVDDNRDGADALGLLLEALGCEVHVTYGGEAALEVAIAFRPDLLLVDLVMPELDGRGLVSRLRQIPDFEKTTIIAITGQKDEAPASVKKVGFNSLLLKPVALAEITAALAGLVILDEGPSMRRGPARKRPADERRLPMDEARRIRNERDSKTLTQAESEAAICDGIIRFQEEYLGWRPERIHVIVIKDLLIVRIMGVLTLAERQLGKSSTPEKGRDVIKQVRKQLMEVARPMLESLIHEVTGVKVESMHHDISTVTGEEVVIFSLASAPRFG